VEAYLLVIDSMNVLQLGTSLSAADLVQQTIQRQTSNFGQNLYKFKGYDT